MRSRTRFVRRLLRTVLPLLLIIVIALLAICIWLVHAITRPPRAAYLVTPETFSNLTGPSSPAQNVTWKNHDGTEARGWLIRGADGAPAIILLHGYGADRSWVLNLAVKTNETTNFTVLAPDVRGHGENPPVSWSLPGAVDGDDVTAALDYLHTLRTPLGKPQVAATVGIYGIELGAYAALDAARRDTQIRALVLDSVPATPDDVIREAAGARTGIKNSLLAELARVAIRVYGAGRYQRTPSCDLAWALKDPRVLLLAGREGDRWRRSTLNIANCFVSAPQIKQDLILTGANLPEATGTQEEAYDRPVIEFFNNALR